MAKTPPCRSLHGERGLKLDIEFAPGQPIEGSLPSRGAWIEIDMSVIPCFRPCRSLHGERGLKCCDMTGESPKYDVAPFTGSVD